MLNIIASGVTLVKFSASWCGPCKVMSKTLSNILPEFPSINLQEIDIDDEPDLSKQYKIKSIPTLIFFKDGEEVERIVGSAKVDALRNKCRDIVS